MNDEAQTKREDVAEAAANANSPTDKATRVAMFVPDSARDNYADKIREDARRNGVSVDEQKARQLEAWRTEAVTNAADGWDHLADWLEDADLDSYGDTALDPIEVGKVKAVQNAKAEPDRPVGAFAPEDQERIVAHREAIADRFGPDRPAADVDTDGDGAADDRVAVDGPPVGAGHTPVLSTGDAAAEPLTVAADGPDPDVSDAAPTVPVEAAPKPSTVRKA